jgi:uncharacterized protein (TIGR02266 family)
MSEKKPKTILIADDTNFFRSMLSFILTEDGYKTVTVCNGAEAMQVVKERYDEIDLFILDLMMPVLNGFEILKSLQGMGKERPLPVLVITQYYLNELEKQILKKHNIVGYINKTASMERILFEINNILFPREENVRKSYRTPVNLPVTYRIGSETFISYCFNLSEDGMFIVVQEREPAEVGTELKIKFWIPNYSQLIEVAGKVAWKNCFDAKIKKSHPPGVGVKFHSVPAQVREAIASFLQTQSLAADGSSEK